jgi:hypothetical protein
MTYSPYGDRESGGARTDLDDVRDPGHPGDAYVDENQNEQDNEFRRDPEQVDPDQVDRSEAEPDQADGYAGDDAVPAQRDPADAVSGDVVDQDGHVVTDDRTDESVDGADERTAAGYDGAGDTAFSEHGDGVTDGDVLAEDGAGTDTTDRDTTDSDTTGTDEADRDVATEREMGTGAYGHTDADVDEVTDAGSTPGVMDSDAGSTPGMMDSGADAGVESDYAATDRATEDRFDLGAGDANAVDSDAVDSSATDSDAVDGSPLYDQAADEAPVSPADNVNEDYVALGVAEPVEPAGEGTATDDGMPAATDAEGETAGMMPGDAPVVAPTAAAATGADSQERWQQVQLGFIDDPRGSVESARLLVVEAVEEKIAALRDKQNALDAWQNDASPDTEVLRATMQGYRDLLTSLSDDRS